VRIQDLCGVNMPIINAKYDSANDMKEEERDMFKRHDDFSSIAPNLTRVRKTFAQII
jgi:hypothetical protein